jgi:uncharacterized membrane protein YeaQ/YmgE (transglycosylase-associated protein family)
MIAAITLGLAGLLGLIVIWIVEGLFKRQPPFGEVVDYLIGLISAVGIAAIDYYLAIPAFFPNTRWMWVVGAISEGAIGAWLVLWIIRLAVRPPFKGEENT